MRAYGKLEAVEVFRGHPGTQLKVSGRIHAVDAATHTLLAVERFHPAVQVGMLAPLPELAAFSVSSKSTSVGGRAFNVHAIMSNPIYASS